MSFHLLQLCLVLAHLLFLAESSLSSGATLRQQRARDSQDYFYVSFYPTQSPCSSQSCTGSATSSLDQGSNKTEWIFLDPKPRDFVVARLFSREPPVWGASIDLERSDGLVLEGSATVQYEIVVPSVGKVSVNVTFAISVAEYDVTSRSISYDAFYSDTPRLSWGLYSSNIFLLCWCPTAEACPNAMCNEGHTGTKILK